MSSRDLHDDGKKDFHPTINKKSKELKRESGTVDYLC